MAASSEISAEFLENEFVKLKERSWQSWTDFEKDLSEFEKRTAIAHRIERSDLVKTVNRRRECLRKARIPECIKYARAMFVRCHYGQFSSRSTGQHKCLR